MGPPEPKALRLYILVATGIVVLGSAAGFLLWWTTHPFGTAVAVEPEDPALDHVILKPVDWLPGTTADERDRIEKCVHDVVLSPPPTRRIGECDGTLTALGQVAAARLVDALHRLNERDGFHSEESRRGLLAADRLLRGIARQLPAAPVPLERRTADVSPGWLLRRAKAWVVWWDAVKAATGTR